MNKPSTKPRTFKIRISDHKSGVNTEVTATFSHDEWQLLMRFRDMAEELWKSPILDGVSVNAQFHWKAGEGMKVTSTLPSDEVLAAFLHKLRPFVLKSEATYLRKMRDFLKRRIEHPAVRRSIESYWELFNSRDMQGMIRISSNGTVLNSDEIVRDWLNAYEYHRDDKKRKRIEALHKLMPVESTKPIVVSLLIDKAKAIFRMAQFITELRDSNNKPFKP